eukprot:CAMPEP_0202346832 /NCGR_PEP_ID=MMETSP1126-20121109/5451_1 /ASSEMBLY_ACC=CAM_ASM_000457 /TAXON_ID=3047 /ORGANISM="Dunaliella tertiolecta, Strain CCMP1320" /LENGTH=437 /DNA_ID=CAMNT_0048938291 /DNA_START=34 /DNA_END=1347 /DNA_ORIENTATION=-
MISLSLLVLFGATLSQALPYSSSSPVVSLDASNFKSRIKNAGGALVEFYAPWCGHCKALSPTYEQVARAMKGSVMVAAVDADAHSSLASEYGIKGFPTIKFVYADGDKIKTSDYNGQRSAKDLINFAFDKAKSLALKRIGEKPSSGGSSGGGGGGGSDSGFYGGTSVVTLTDSNFRDQVTKSKDLWMVEFYAPWCGHCKALKPAWIESAAELKGKVNFGAVDCTVHQGLCSQFGVQGYPTIKFFGSSKASPEDYNMGRDSSSITTFATNKWSRLAPAPEVHELSGPDVWEKECMGSDGEAPKQLCFLAFLPDILDSKAAGRNAYISTMKKVAEKYKDRPFSYLWAQGGSQPELESSVGVGGFGYPALVALKPKDGRYSPFQSAFEQQHITEFVDSIRKGGAVVLSVQGDVGPVRSVEKWDGKDAAVQLEDEFDLSEL